MTEQTMAQIFLVSYVTLAIYMWHATKGETIGARLFGITVMPMVIQVACAMLLGVMLVLFKIFMLAFGV